MDVDVFSRNNSTLNGSALTMSYLENIMGLAMNASSSGSSGNLTTKELLDLFSSQFSKQDLVELQFFSTLYTFIVPLTFAFIVLVGLVGNVLVVVITLSAPDLRSTVNLLLVNLAISDISFLVLCVPLTTYHFAASRWDIGDFACRLHHYVLYVSLYSTSYTHVLIAVVRFLHIVYARRMMRLERYTKPTLAIVWVTILIFNIPILLIYRVNELDMYAYCGTVDSETNGLYLIVSFFVLSYFLPLFFISVLYLLVARHLRKKQKMAKHRKKLLISAKVSGAPAHAQVTTRKVPRDEKEKQDVPRDQEPAIARGAIKATNILTWIPGDASLTRSRDTKGTIDTSKNLLSSASESNLKHFPIPKGEGEREEVPPLKTDLDQVLPTTNASFDGQVQCIPGEVGGENCNSAIERKVEDLKRVTNEQKTLNLELSTASHKGSVSQPGDRITDRKMINRKRSSHVTKLCFLVVLVFGISWLPLQLYLLMAYCGFKPQNKWYQAYRPLCHVMAYSNASVNPIIYHYVSRDFRQSLRRKVTRFRSWWRPGN